MAIAIAGLGFAVPNAGLREVMAFATFSQWCLSLALLCRWGLPSRTWSDRIFVTPRWLVIRGATDHVLPVSWIQDVRRTDQGTLSFRTSRALSVIGGRTEDDQSVRRALGIPKRISAPEVAARLGIDGIRLATLARWCGCGESDPGEEAHFSPEEVETLRSRLR